MHPYRNPRKRALLEMDTFRTPPVRDVWAQWLRQHHYAKFLTDVVAFARRSSESSVTINRRCAKVRLGAESSLRLFLLHFLLASGSSAITATQGFVDPTDELYLDIVSPSPPPLSMRGTPLLRQEDHSRSPVQGGIPSSGYSQYLCSGSNSIDPIHRCGCRLQHG